MEMEKYVHNRFQPEERRMLLAVPYNNRLGTKVDADTSHSINRNSMPIVHVVIPQDMKDIDVSGVKNGRSMLYSWVNMYGGLDGIRIELPALVERKVISVEPGVKGNPASGKVTNPAVVEGGYELAVPLFINEGDVIRIHTDSGEYNDRTSTK